MFGPYKLSSCFDELQGNGEEIYLITELQPSSTKQKELIFEQCGDKTSFTFSYSTNYTIPILLNQY